MLTYSVLSFLQFHYFDEERMQLIDQQIDRTISVLASSRLSRAALSSSEKAADFIFETLEDDPPNQVILLRRLDGSIFYRNELAETLGLALPAAPGMQSIEVENHRLRYLTYPLPDKGVILQVGLVLDQREVSWDRIIGKTFIFSLLVMLAFIALAAVLTNYLLRPVRELALYFKYQALESTEPFSLPPKAVDSPEFRLLGATIQSVSERWRELLLQHSSMMARLVHEIRTPLTILRNKLEPLAADAPVKEALGELDHMESVTRDFMNWSKLEYSLPADTELHAIPLQSFVEKLGCVISRRERLKLEFHLDPAQKIFAKPEHLRLICENLIENACRYGEGEILVAVSAADFSVSSRGQAVPEAVTAQLGKPFNRGGEASGTGLGLANVVSLCKKYGWTLAYQRLGEANVFTVRFGSSPG